MQLRLQCRPFARRVGGQTLIEQGHHQAALARGLQRAAERRRDRKAAFGVQSVAISPFEHSALGVFHTFFHFSTPGREGPSGDRRYRTHLRQPPSAGVHFMTSAQIPAETYLATRARLGIKFGLETMRALLDALGHPERAFAALTVAGTNGKGSVAAYADAVLRASGLHAARYTSPHLVRVH